MQKKLAKIVFLSFCLAGPTGATWAQSSFQYLENSDFVVVRYSRTPGELSGADTSTTLTVYGNGRTLVHYPPYGKRRGDYEMILPGPELDVLVATLVNAGVMEFDGQAIAIEQQAIMQASGMGYYTGDADISSIEVALTRYTPKDAPERLDVRKQVSPSALQTRARQFSTIPALVNLAEAERQLIKLINNDNLELIESID